MPQQYILIFKRLTEIFILVIALTYKALTNFFIWIFILLVLNIYFYSEITKTKDSTLKLKRVNVQNIQAIPDLELKEEIFNKSQSQKMDEINKFLSTLPNFNNVSIEHILIKKSEKKNLMQANIKVKLYCSFNELVYTVSEIRKVGYKISKAEISNPESSLDNQQIELEFSAVYYK